MQFTELKMTCRPETKWSLVEATISRQYEGDTIRVVITTHDKDGKASDPVEHIVQTACEEDVFSMAECLQCHMEGCHGTNTMIHDYLRILEFFTE